jgi:hypothetical protein
MTAPFRFITKNEIGNTMGRRPRATGGAFNEHERFFPPVSWANAAGRLAANPGLVGAPGPGRDGRRMNIRRSPAYCRQASTGKTIMAPSETTPEAAALMRGRREGLATAALAAGCIAFINLLGAEKDLLAIVLAGLAIGGLPAGSARRRALAAFGLGGLHLAIVAAIVIAGLTLYHDKVMHLLLLAKNLG